MTSIFSRMPSALRNGASAEVSTAPTASAFTRIFGASSLANSRVRCDSPAFAAPYAEKPRSVTRPIADDTFTIAPDPCASMCGTARRDSRNAEVTLKR